MNPHKPRHRTTNWLEYNRSLQNRASLTVWMSPDIPWLGNGRTGDNGRPQVYTDAAIQAVLTMKVLFKLALRQARGLVSSLVKLLGLDWPVPCFSTDSRRQVTLTVDIPIRQRAEPLIYWSTAPESKSVARASGRSKNMARSTAALGGWPRCMCAARF
ncbi:transposase [Neisseriaceae bacterium JH1-16]|nr:transposase [Neisseriaceae bacterium JH1-16]